MLPNLWGWKMISNNTSPRFKNSGTGTGTGKFTFHRKDQCSTEAAGGVAFLSDKGLVKILLLLNVIVVVTIIICLWSGDPLGDGGLYPARTTNNIIHNYKICVSIIHCTDDGKAQSMAFDWVPPAPPILRVTVYSARFDFKPRGRLVTAQAFGKKSVAKFGLLCSMQYAFCILCTRNKIYNIPNVMYNITRNKQHNIPNVM